MINKETVLNALRSQGRVDALDLRNRASQMDGTSIIAEEEKIPIFNPQKDYSTWKVGSPVVDEEQVWTLLQPYNAAHHEGRPSSLRALWEICHTKDPQKAKPWMNSYGISGRYELDECYRSEDGKIFQQIYNGKNEYNATALPERWKMVL